MADRSSRQRDALRSVAVVAVFVIVGPFIGFLSFLAWDLARVPAEQEAVRAFILLSSVVTVLVAYIVGVPIALFTGAIAAIASRRLKSTIAWIGVTTAVGSSLSALGQPLLAPDTDRILVTACGALSAFLCSAFTATLRPGDRQGSVAHPGIRR